tara:strand:+ start:1405 stop:2133 length:729 start_codon:yes stop_codon:yes gene_type:complete
MKKRLDLLLVEKSFFNSRTSAQVHIIAGEVFVNDEKVLTPSKLIDSGSRIEIKLLKDSFVSRGGIKLEEAINYYQINIKDKICLDIGASTGGFTDCLLRKEALKVYSVDVGYGQLDYKLRNHNKVVNIEKLNARYLTKNKVPDQIDVIVMDVSFISITKFEKFFSEFSNNKNIFIGLIKPQFELSSDKIGKNGIVKNSEFREYAVNNVRNFLSKFYNQLYKTIESPIKGAKGNIEYLICCKN